MDGHGWMDALECPGWTDKHTIQCTHSAQNNKHTTKNTRNTRNTTSTHTSKNTKKTQSTAASNSNTDAHPRGGHTLVQRDEKGGGKPGGAERKREDHVWMHVEKTKQLCANNSLCANNYIRQLNQHVSLRQLG